MGVKDRVEKLKLVITGWVNYFGIADMSKLAEKLDEWLRRRIRMCYCKQWKKIKTKYDNLVNLGIDNGKVGNMPTQEKATGEYPIAQFLV